MFARFNQKGMRALSLKLDKLRSLMAERKIDAYIVTNIDSHNNGNVSAYWKSRAYVSGFTGSAGTLVIMKDMAGLWTDGRYFIQAEKQLDGSGIELFRSGEPNVPSYTKFFKEKLEKGQTVGFYGQQFSIGAYNDLEKALKEKEIKYSYTDDLVDMIWDDRPEAPSNKVYLHAPPFTAKTSEEKISEVQAKMKEETFDYVLVSGLDAIAWLFNIRGTDVPNLPIVYAHAIISADKAHLFIGKDKISDITLPDSITIHPYEDVAKFLETINDGKLYYNSNVTNYLLSQAVKTKDIVTEYEEDIIQKLKGTKSKEDIANIKNANIKEGVVLTQIFKWLEEEVPKGKLKEADVARKLTELRKNQKDFVSDSFSAIIAYGENAASAHYSPGSEGSDIKPDGLLLVDTGGNYLDGTTDTTRTIAVGALTEEMKRDYTLVLKGNINMSDVVFMKGTTGPWLDILARQAMWKHGINYRHGTGHGIGYFLNVHEGPHTLSMSKNSVELEPGMIISNEPGIYRPGKYGIRTETTIHVTECMKTEDGEFYKFETISPCPIDTTPIIIEMMTQDEIKWLNDYHSNVYEVLSPLLSEDEKKWLKKATAKI